MGPGHFQQDYLQMGRGVHNFFCPYGTWAFFLSICQSHFFLMTGWLLFGLKGLIWYTVWPESGVSLVENDWYGCHIFWGQLLWTGTTSGVVVKKWPLLEQKMMKSICAITKFLVPLEQGFWYFMQSQSCEIQVNLRNPMFTKHAKYCKIC